VTFERILETNETQNENLITRLVPLRLCLSVEVNSHSGPFRETALLTQRKINDLLNSTGNKNQ
jgi:hypothetical protein